MSKKVRDFTNGELVFYLNRNQDIRPAYLIEIISEILRRMNEKTPLLPKEEEVDWGNPLTP